MSLRSKGKRNQRSRGAAMLLVLIALAMCTILALSFLASQEPTAVVAKNIDRKTQARAIAESALKMAIDYVNENATWRTDKSSGVWMTDVVLDGGTFTLSGTDSDDGDLADDSSEAVTLSVVATYAGVTHRVSAIVSPGNGGSAGTDLLMVVGDSGSLTTAEQGLQTLFGNWGYTVTLLSDSESQANYDTAVAANDVVYITGNVSAGSVGTKLLNANIGVVITKPWLHDDFGLTDDNTTTSDSTTTTDIADNSHMITEGFSLGSLAIFQSAGAIPYTTQIVASGVMALTDRSAAGTNASLMVANTGATLHTGAAAGRRVIFPFGGTYDAANLSASGQILLWRSLQWAAGANSVPPMRIALYEFNEQSVATPTLMGHWKLDEQVDPGFGGVSVAGTGGDGWFWIKNAARVNSYDSSLGTYASQTPTNNAVVTVNSTQNDYFYVESTGYVGGDAWIGAGGNTSDVIWFNGSATLTGTENVMTSSLVFPTFGAPTGMPASSGNFDRSNGSTTISSDVTYDRFNLSGSARVTISGDVTIWVQGTGDGDGVSMVGSSKVIIPEGSSLTMYVADDIDIEQDAEFNADTTGTDRFTLYGYGARHVDLKENAIMCGIVYTVDSFHIKDNSRFYGKVLAWEDIKMEDNSQIHQDLALGGFEVGSGSGASVRVEEDIWMQNTSLIDAYDPANGAYGASNQFLATTVITNDTGSDDVWLNNSDIYGDVYIGSGGSVGSVIDLESGSTISGTQSAQASDITIPSPSTPSGFGSDTGNTTYDGGSHTWSSNQHFDDLTIRNAATVTVSGDVQIRVSGDMQLDNADIVLSAGATLTIYLGDDLRVLNTSTINNDTTRPDDVSIIQYGNGGEKDVILDNGVIVGSVHVEDDLTIQNNSHIYGSVTVEDDLIMNNGEIHVNIDTSSDVNSGDRLDTALDDTATANDGTVNGSVTGGSAGVIDTAYAFDGVADYIEIPHDSSYLLDQGSVSMHYYPTSTSGIGPLFSKDASGQGAGGHVYIYRNGTRIAAKIETTSDDPYGTGVTLYLQSSTGVVTRDVWNHVALTWGDGQVRLYADGVLVDSLNHLGGLGATSGGSGNAEPIVLGANSQNSTAGSATPLESDYFEGRIDDVRIYDVPADATQVGNLAAGSDPGARTAPGYVIADTSSYSTAADFLIYDATAVSWLGGGGLQVNSDTLATTVGAAAKIHDGIEATGEFSVELIITRMTPGSTDRPSYIFNYSDTTASAFNVLIGQGDENYEAQVRDSDTGTTGVLSPALLSTTALNTGSDTHLVISYSAGEVRTFVDGVLDETRTTIGTLNNWDATYFMVLFGAYDEAEHWNGTIKRMAIFDRAMNASQAESVYNGEEPGDGVGGTGVARWDEQD